MSEQYVPALRRRYFEEGQIKNLQEKIQTMYLRGMRTLRGFCGACRTPRRSPALSPTSNSSPLQLTLAAAINLKQDRLSLGSLVTEAV
jgi:hypothetical protein